MKPAWLSRAIRILRLIRFKPFDADSEEGRTNERYRRAALTTLANLISKLLAMAILLISVPLTLSYLGTERFGIWTTISSLTALLAFLDFGIGNGLLNQVAQASALNDRQRLRRVISNGLLVLSLLGLVVGAALSAAAHWAPWLALIKVGDAALIDEIRTSASAFAIVFALSLPFVGLQRVFLGLQEGFLVHAASAVANVIALVALCAVTHGKGGIPMLIMATFGIQALSPLILVLPLLRRRLLARVSSAEFREDARALTRTGWLFFVLQIGAMVGWGSDSLIVSSMLGAEQAAVLAVAFRLFQFVSQPLAMAVNPLWSSYADAATRRDTAYIRKTLKLSLALCFALAVTGSSIVLLFHDWLIVHWARGSVQVPLLLAVGYALWSVFDVCGNAFAMFLNGVGVLRPQLIVVGLFCALAIPLKIVLVQRVGVSGVVLATLITYLLTVVLPYLTFLRPAWTARLRAV
jgi:O-antigen/teichoic acid export membrane protein